MTQHLFITAYDRNWTREELEEFSLLYYIRLMNAVDNDENVLIEIFNDDGKEWADICSNIESNFVLPTDIRIIVENIVH